MNENNTAVASKPAVVNVGTILDNAKVGSFSVKLILVCAFAVFLYGFDTVTVSNAAPVILKQWNITSAAFGIVFSSWTLGCMAGMLILGSLANKLGRRKTILIAVGIVTLMSICTVFATNVATLTVIRVLDGVGSGGLIPCAVTLMSDYAPVKSKAKFVIFMNTGSSVGAVIGALTAASIVKSLGWHSLFITLFIFCVIGLILLFAAIPESIRWLASRAETEGGKATIRKILKKIQPDAEFDENVSFIAESSKKQEKVPLKELFAGKFAWLTPVIWLYFFLSSLTVFFINNWLPTLLVNKGATASGASSIIAVASLFAIIGALGVAVFIDKAGLKLSAIFPLIAAAIIMLIGRIGGVGGAMTVIACLTMMFMNGEHSIIVAMGPQFYPSSNRSQASGISMAIGKFGATIGPFIGGFLIATKLALPNLFIIVALPLIVCTVLCFILGTAMNKKAVPGKN